MTPDESIAALKELLLSEISNIRALVEEKDGRYLDLVEMKTRAVLDLLEEKNALYLERATSGKTAVDAALAAAKTLNDTTFAASEKAIGKSDQNAEKWRENANEWRAAMQDREAKFAGRIEVENELKNLRMEIASMKEILAAGKGKEQGISASWALLIGVVVLLGGLIGIAGALYGALKP